MSPFTCKHFTGLHNKTHCAAGVAYEGLDGFPCIKAYLTGPTKEPRPNERHKPSCDKYEEPTAGELKAHEEKMNQEVAELNATLRLYKPKDPETKFYNLFFDPENPDVEIAQDKLKEYLQTKYGITDTQGTRSMICHTDGSDWFGYIYEWTVSGRKFIQSIRQKRKHSW